MIWTQWMFTLKSVKDEKRIHTFKQKQKSNYKTLNFKKDNDC